MVDGSAVKMSLVASCCCSCQVRGVAKVRFQVQQCDAPATYVAHYRPGRVDATCEVALGIGRSRSLSLQVLQLHIRHLGILLLLNMDHSTARTIPLHLAMFGIISPNNAPLYVHSYTGSQDELRY